MEKYVQELFDFIGRSPTAAHGVQAAREMLEAAGFQELREAQPWQLGPGGKYFVTRGLTSVMAFKYPGQDFKGFSIVASHSDSPCFKVKGSPEMRVDGQYTKLNTEVYGGALLAPWFDRPLSVAGRLVVRTSEGIKAVLADIDRDLLVIPSLAIHLDREANNGRKLDTQKDTLPLLGGEEGDILALAAEAAGVKKDDVLSYDLYLYNRAKGAVCGAGGEFLCCPRLDDLECAFSSLQAFLQAENPVSCTVCAIFDSEETGSHTRQGADSTLLEDLLGRICLAAGKTEEERLLALSSSAMLSADNAHAVHPNYPEKSDPTSRCYLNGGIAVKHGVRYATDAVSAALFAKLCQDAGVPIQSYYNHSSIPAGGTLGNISGSHVSIPTVDIGLTQLAMHSPCETAGSKDLAYMVRAMAAFYGCAITCQGDGLYTLAPAGEATPVDEKCGEPPLGAGSPSARQGSPAPSQAPQAAPAGPGFETDGPGAGVGAAAAQPAPLPEETPAQAGAGSPLTRGGSPAPAPAPQRQEEKGMAEQSKPVQIENKPGWQNEAVFYQIYAMGFCGAPYENDGKLEHRILKVEDWAPHLQKLGHPRL